MTVCLAVYLYYRGKGATTQTCNLLKRKKVIGRGTCRFINPEGSPESVENKG